MAVLRRALALDLQVDAVGREIGASRRQVQRAFEEAGTTFRTALWVVRMDHAAILLRERPELSIKQVAASCGYRQPAQFAEAFRRHHGVAPSAWRQPAATATLADYSPLVRLGGSPPLLAAAEG
jgi:AraC family transcriptional regulator of adaptative response / methylphosphotriester-DNA alkyltransferase methyltransferase